MMEKIYIRVTGVFFGFVGIAQMIRAFFKVPIHVSSFEIPVWPSWIASVLALGLCVWALWIAGHGRRNAGGSA
jgi:hypothetical protein